MEPFDTGVRPDRSVLRRLKRLDRKLKITFSPYNIDLFTGRVIESEGVIDTVTGDRNVGAVLDPCFYLWRVEGSHHTFVATYPMHEGGFNHESVLKLESDLARFHRPEDCWRIIEESHKKGIDRKRAAHADDMRQKALDAKPLMKRIVEGDGDHLFHREARAFSYRGASAKSTADTRIERSPRELGIGE